MKVTAILTAVAFGTLSFAALAQQSAPPPAAAPAPAPQTAPAVRPAAPPPGTAAARSQRQQDRIAQGVRSGQLTAGETRNLESREASVNREKRNMRAQDNGHLTAGDRRALNRRQNHISRSIYRDKHNAARR